MRGVFQFFIQVMQEGKVVVLPGDVALAVQLAQHCCTILGHAYQGGAMPRFGPAAGGEPCTGPA